MCLKGFKVWYIIYRRRIMVNLFLTRIKSLRRFFNKSSNNNSSNENIQLEIIRHSNLFDSKWYLARNIDVKQSGVDPILHYVKYGWKEGRDPNPNFDGRKYFLALNLDAQSQIISPLTHSILCDNKNGKSSPVINTQPVLSQPQNVAKKHVDHFFSIIVASYNCRDYIHETLESLISQDYENFEVIIVDDGSTDDSLNVIEKYTKYPFIHLYQHKNGTNKGLPETIKLGLEHAKGKYIAFCESDDYWTFDHLKKLNTFINNNPNAEIIVNDVQTFGDTNKCQAMDGLIQQLKNELLSNNGIIPKEQFRTKNYITTFSACCVQKILLLSCNFLDVTTNSMLDWWLWRQICLDNKIYYLNSKLTYWRMHDSYNIKDKEAERLQQEFINNVDILIKKREYTSVTINNLKYEDYDIFSKLSFQLKRKNIHSQIITKGVAGLKILYISTTSHIQNPITDPSSRYRCYHPAEVLNKQNFVSVVSAHNFILQPSYDYDIYIFHRPGLVCSEVVNKLKALNKFLIADYDDLIFGLKETAIHVSVYKSGLVTLPQAEEIFKNNLEALVLFDNFTASTECLVNAIRHFKRKSNIAVVHNFIPSSILQIANKQKIQQQIKDKNLLMYCSGTMSHNKDFLIVEDILLKALDSNPNLKLYIFGALKVSEKLKRQSRIYFHEPVPYWNLFSHMANAAYTIAPLEDTVFNDCKSNVKFLESAIVGSTLIASPIPDMKRIKDAAILLPENADDWNYIVNHLEEIDVQKNKKKNYDFLLKNCSEQTFLLEFASLFNNMKN